MSADRFASCMCVIIPLVSENVSWKTVLMWHSVFSVHCTAPVILGGEKKLDLLILRQEMQEHRTPHTAAPFCHEDIQACLHSVT